MTKTLNPAKAELLGYVSNPLVQILRAEARDKVLTGEKVALNIGSPVRTLYFEPLWLMNSREQVIDYNLRTYISYNEYKELLDNIENTKKMVAKIAKRVVETKTNLELPSLLKAVQAGAVTIDPVTDDILMNGAVIIPGQVKEEDGAGGIGQPTTEDTDIADLYQPKKTKAKKTKVTEEANDEAPKSKRTRKKASDSDLP